MLFNTNNYTVIMDLKSPELDMEKTFRSRFKADLKKIGAVDKDFWEICSYEHGILRYESETFLLVVSDSNKQKVLIVMGNPAIHSVKNGMFFFRKKM